MKTFKDLENAIENDSERSHFKKGAELLLVAANDWPSLNMSSIDAFILELEDFFESPLVLQSLLKKEVDLKQDNNSWRLESLSSILEIFELPFENGKNRSLNSIIDEILIFFNRYKTDNYE